MVRYEVIGAFDTETTNIGNAATGYRAFPILFQLGLIGEKVEKITPENSSKHIKVETFRKAEALYSRLDILINQTRDYIPVILVHNLGFDMYSLAPWLRTKRTRILAKTAQKPISIQILDDNEQPKLVFLDTLGLFMKSLATMGQECGMPKASGDWDYMLVRSPYTLLTDEELNYAKQDIITLLCYMGYFLRQNPDINPAEIGFKVQTKTGVVRAKRMKHIGNIKSRKLKYRVQQYWHLQNKEQVPKSDNELFIMHTATRGGFTFVAKNNASKVFLEDENTRLVSYDSTSQHPGQMCSHLYPVNFTEADSESMLLAFEAVTSASLERVLKYWLKPFPYAFYGAFTFDNLRPKEGSLFEKYGIYPEASARLLESFPVYDNEAGAVFKNTIGKLGYKDSGTNLVTNFGKLESASRVTLYLTELEAWLVSMCYSYNSVEAEDGFLSSTFRKPSDMSLLSVMRFYKAKNALKSFMSSYELEADNDTSIIEGLYPDSFVKKCRKGESEPGELKEYYSLAKADLNALFGIEATNEARRDFELNQAAGFELVGEEGLHNMPRTPKCFYQYGARIVGWSRIAQVVVMELIAPHIKEIICGDTDSLKFSYDPKNEKKIASSLNKYAKAFDKAKRAVTKRVKLCYPKQFDGLDGIGHYVFDGGYQGLSAAWNKSYITLEGGSCHITIAGIPASRRTPEYGTYEDFCNELMNRGWSFEEVASLAIGYNVTLDSNITKLNARYHPKLFGEYIELDVEDYLGNVSRVRAPEALALFPGVKTIGDTLKHENLNNSKIAIENNPNVNIKPVWLKWVNGEPSIIY